MGEVKHSFLSRHRARIQGRVQRAIMLRAQASSSAVADTWGKPWYGSDTTTVIGRQHTWQSSM